MQEITVINEHIFLQIKKTFDPTTSYLVEGLKPNTEYLFRLAARSQQGQGAWTSDVKERTMQSSKYMYISFFFHLYQQKIMEHSLCTRTVAIRLKTVSAVLYKTCIHIKHFQYVTVFFYL